MTAIYASIGNSDDKLSQERWSTFARQFVAEISQWAQHVHGVWYSRPDSRYQNACVCFEIPDELRADHLKVTLATLAGTYEQDSIAWAVAETEFIAGAR